MQCPAIGRDSRRVWDGPMHSFNYRGRELYCERLPLRRVAEAVGTPVYVYSRATLLDHYRKLAAAFRELKPLICFSMKANGSPAVCRTLVRAGSGLDVVSGGELYKALKVGCRPENIVFASVGKTREEIRAALRAGILLLNVESLPELDMVASVASALHRRARVALRVNPDIDPRTHAFISTGHAESKFGIDVGAAERIFHRRHRYPSVELTGIHCHIGSQITTPQPFVRALRIVGALIGRLRRIGAAVEWLNIGGGLGIIYADERPQTADAFARAVLPLVRPLGVRLILEPGRFIAGSAGVLLTRVLYIKEAPHKRFVVVDAGMNDLIRPALYDAYHEIQPLQRRDGRPVWRVDVVGPVCESGDFLAKDRRMAAVNAGEYVAVMGAGAYAASMGSRYNARRLPPEVMVRGGRWAVTRARETYADLLTHERMPRGW